MKQVLKITRVRILRLVKQKKLLTIPMRIKESCKNTQPQCKHFKVISQKKKQSMMILIMRKIILMSITMLFKIWVN